MLHWYISTHAPRTGSDGNGVELENDAEKISTHAPRTGSDEACLCLLRNLFAFQPTLPARGATNQAGLATRDGRISTHAPRTGSDKTRLAFHRALPKTISTHAPRTGSDRISAGLLSSPQDFNPRSPHGERPDLEMDGSKILFISTHAPRTGSDECQPDCHAGCVRFQPTLPARGATTERLMCAPIYCDFNPRSPHGERPTKRKKRAFSNRISTHAPRTGSDANTHAAGRDAAISTHAPRTGSDALQSISVNTPEISTHAPRTGSDVSPKSRCTECADFNPRSPHGERPDLWRCWTS